MNEKQRELINRRQITECHPAFAVKVQAILSDLEKIGWKPYVADAWRSPAEQERKFMAGASKVRYGFHCVTSDSGNPEALAVDVVDARWGWKSPEGFWRDLGSSARAHSCTWGGSWKTFVDKAHVQYYPNSKLAAVKKGLRP